MHCIYICIHMYTKTYAQRTLVTLIINQISVYGANPTVFTSQRFKQESPPACCIPAAGIWIHWSQITTWPALCQSLRMSNPRLHQLCISASTLVGSKAVRMVRLSKSCLRSWEPFDDEHQWTIWAGADRCPVQTFVEVQIAFVEAGNSVPKQGQHGIPAISPIP